MADILDTMMGKLLRRLRLFQEGWGNRILLEQVHKSAQLFYPYEPTLEVQWHKEIKLGSTLIKRGSFSSPSQYGVIPLAEECHKGYIELILPRSHDSKTPICIHFAATGDEGYIRRRLLMALPLLKLGIGSLILENPYYGQRRPLGQSGCCLRKVEDLWAMAWATVEEGRALVNWLDRSGFQNKGVTGISMGGFMAAAVGALSPYPLAIIPCLSPHSGVPIFTEGLITNSCSWSFLAKEFGEKHLHAKKYLRKLLEITDIRTLPPPTDTRTTILVSAKYDAIVPPQSARILHRHWKGSEVRWLNTGHSGAFFFYRSAFIKAISDSFQRLIKLNMNE
jgi:hypothetical protein